MKYIISFIQWFSTLFTLLIFLRVFAVEQTESTVFIEREIKKQSMTSVVDSFEMLITDVGIRHPKVVLAQMVHETNWFTSRIYHENKNYFGMKYNTRGYSIGIHRGHAKYSSYEDSLLDYAAWQRRVLALSKKRITTDEEYLKLLDNLPICKNCRYAEDPKYTKSILLRMTQLEELRH